MNVAEFTVQTFLPKGDNTQFFTDEELQRFKDLAKKHHNLDLSDTQAFDQFHKLFLLAEDIAKNPSNGTMNI